MDNPKDKNEHPLYEKTLISVIGEFNISSYREIYTKLELLYVSMADEYLADALNRYIKNLENKLRSIMDIIELRETYEQITHITGESIMETLNLKLKQKFLIAPSMSIFMQGFTENLLARLTARDIQTSKEIFQLVLDNISEI